MKCIRQIDLERILPYIKDVGTWDIDDFKKLLDKFGDDWFAEGGEFHLVTENENMKAFREQWKMYRQADCIENVYL